MCSGYVIVCRNGLKVLCLATDKKTLSMTEVTSPSILNKAVCAPDLTEAKNVLRRIQATEEYADVVDGAEIQHVARLYKKFF